MLVPIVEKDTNETKIDPWKSLEIHSKTLKHATNYNEKPCLFLNPWPMKARIWDKWRFNSIGESPTYFTYNHRLEQLEIKSNAKMKTYWMLCYTKETCKLF
jgi:hypothetical protein